jgi:hypothetical protein
MVQYTGTAGAPVLTRAAVMTVSGTAAANTIVPVDTTAGAVTVTLPTAPAQGTVVVVKAVVFGAGNNVTFACGGADVINTAGGPASGTLKAVNQAVYLCYDTATAIWTDLADDLPLSYLDTLFLQLAGGTMAGAIAMGANKITGLANGSGAQDAAAFGQLPSAGTPLPLSEGGTGLSEASNAALLAALGAAPQASVGWLGTGTDGAIVLDGVTAYNGFSSLAGSTYTLTRDVQAASLTINNGVTLATAQCRVFCTGTITNNGTISAAGNNAAAGAAGGSLASHAFVGGRGGGAGGTGVSGAGGNGGAVNYGAAGGAGGAGTAGAAGAGGTAGTSSAIFAAHIGTLPFSVIAGTVAYAGQNNSVEFGAGGGGGGSDVAANAGGGGGGGGGTIALFAAAVVNNGTITAAGGNGAAGTGGNAGGGGGGAGGAILAYTLTAWTAGTTSVAGGTAGAGSGTGSGGSNGGAGLVLNSVL